MAPSNQHRAHSKKAKLIHLYIQIKKESKFWDRRISDSLFQNIMKKNRRKKDIDFDRKYNKLLVKLTNNDIQIQQFLKKYIFLQLLK